MAGTGALFRLSNAGDTESSVGSTEKVEFGNGAVVPDAFGRIGGGQSEFEIGVGIADNMVPTSADSPTSGILSEKQYLGQFDKMVKIVGYFTRRSTSTGPDNLTKWADENQEPTDFPEGNIGLRLDTFNAFDLVPTSTTGYYLTNIKFILDPKKQTPIGFIASLKRGKAA